MREKCRKRHAADEERMRETEKIKSHREEINVASRKYFHSSTTTTAACARQVAAKVANSLTRGKGRV